MYNTYRHQHIIRFDILYDNWFPMQLTNGVHIVCRHGILSSMPYAIRHSQLVPYTDIQLIWNGVDGMYRHHHINNSITFHRRQVPYEVNVIGDDVSWLCIYMPHNSPLPAQTRFSIEPTYKGFRMHKLLRRVLRYRFGCVLVEAIRTKWLSALQPQSKLHECWKRLVMTVWATVHHRKLLNMRSTFEMVHWNVPLN